MAQNQPGMHDLGSYSLLFDPPAHGKGNGDKGESKYGEWAGRELEGANERREIGPERTSFGVNGYILEVDVWDTRLM